MKIKKIKENVYEIPKEGKMNVPGIVYASDNIINMIKKDKTLEQVKNVSELPGIIGKSIALSDCHQGYGFPIGGVAAFDMEQGIISPGGVGYDINCSVRLLRTNLTIKDLEPIKEKIAQSLQRKIPSGVGRGSPFQLNKKQLDEILEGGAQKFIEMGYGKKEDYLHMEEEGCIVGGNSSKVSDRAKKRGIGQLGTLGAGNHFLDVLVVDEIFDENVAKKFGLSKNQIVILIHCGSRGLGHQVASDYIKKMEKEYGIKNLPDRELINAPIKSELGKDYFSAMACAANFAFANKQLITHWVREDLKNYFPNIKIDVVYDVCHNIAKFEEFEIGGKAQKVCVHRKGATRSFGPGREEIPKTYREVGQPVLIPGSMGTSSYVLVGTKKAEELTFGSSVHGAGRAMSRSKSGKRDLKEIDKELENKKIIVKSGSRQSLADENTLAYKNIDEVVNVVHDLGISLKVAKLKPLIVVIG
ncbi:MAG TPA: RtcB family protein [Candidatus Nanoarchaeia archaeon]|nr:RtcB family protein [Candidatus Nanoarchaeia archaeon]